MSEHLMTDPAEVKTFALAGNARLTLVSKATKARYSYRVKASDDGAVHFVSVLTGSDNENGYSYLGIVGKDGSFRVTAKSKIAAHAPSALAFAWFWSLVEAGRLHDKLEVWHEGRCGRCARVLTVPESIANGIGPECAKYVLGEAPSFPFEAGEATAMTAAEGEALTEVAYAVVAEEKRQAQPRRSGGGLRGRRMTRKKNRPDGQRDRGDAQARRPDPRLRPRASVAVAADAPHCGGRPDRRGGCAQPRVGGRATSSAC